MNDRSLPVTLRPSYAYAFLAPLVALGMGLFLLIAGWVLSEPVVSNAAPTALWLLPPTVFLGFYIGKSCVTVVISEDLLHWGPVRIKRSDILSVTAVTRRVGLFFGVGRQSVFNIVEVRLKNRSKYPELRMGLFLRSISPADIVIYPGLFKESRAQIESLLLEPEGRNRHKSR